MVAKKGGREGERGSSWTGNKEGTTVMPSGVLEPEIDRPRAAGGGVRGGAGAARRVHGSFTLLALWRRERRGVDGGGRGRGPCCIDISVVPWMRSEATAAIVE